LNTIIKNVRSGFQRELIALPWLEDNTRHWALTKASEMKGSIGYNDWIRDASKVDAILGNVGIILQHFHYEM
jgi:predicted metalloendopeptidase